MSVLLEFNRGSYFKAQKIIEICDMIQPKKNLKISAIIYTKDMEKCNSEHFACSQFINKYV